MLIVLCCVIKSVIFVSLIILLIRPFCNGQLTAGVTITRQLMTGATIGRETLSNMTIILRTSKSSYFNKVEKFR